VKDVLENRPIAEKIIYDMKAVTKANISDYIVE